MSYSSASSISATSSIATTGNSRNGPPRSAPGTRRRWFPVACNKCKQPVDSTVFVCSCRCLFCEDCTYSHFNSNPNCPCCGRLLGENDFTEVTVSDAGSTLANNPDQVLQNLLTKASNQPGAPITWNDVCAAMIREQDALHSNTRFFVKQFVRETQNSLQEGRNAKNQVQAYRKQLVALKEDITGLKRQHEEDTERMRHKDRQLAEKDRQIHQLKAVLARNTSNDTGQGTRGWEPPPSSRSHPLSVGIPKPTPSSQHSTGGERRQTMAGFENYVRKKEARELEQERDLMNLTRKTNPMQSYGRRRR